MKVAVIGGGSTYTPELLKGFLERTESLPIRELWLMDVDAERLAVVGGFAQRMAEAHGAPFRVVLTDSQRDAVRGATYVTTQLRVGHMPARREDEYLGMRHGLIGQETTGVGGMAKALRTIPVILSIARDMRELAPGGLLVNFTNPAGLVTEALATYAPDVPAVGLCNIPINMKMTLLRLLKLGEQIAPERASLKTLGLNHLSWHYGFTVDGEDVWPQAFQSYMAEQEAQNDPHIDLRTMEVQQMIPSYYMSYFHQTSTRLAEQLGWPPSRAEAVMKIEDELLRQYAELDRHEPPEGLMQRGGAYYSTAATQLLNAHYNDLGEIHVVNTRQGGAVPGYPADWVMELPCEVRRSGITPLPAEPLPPASFGLVAQVKSYEQLTAKAAVYGDRKAAYEALLAHPLGPESDKVQAVLDDMLAVNRRYLPQFFAL